MKKLLITGGTGFIGRNLLAPLSQKYIIEAPRRGDLDLMDGKAVYEYLDREKFDVVIHTANPVRNKVDAHTRVLEESLRLFMSFYSARHLFDKLIYLGSGAEYDKSREIKLVTEEQVFESLPKDEYGLGKYIMNALAVKSENVYNLRLFACFGAYEHESRFITHAIKCCLKKEPITIRQDCYFDYMHVEDIRVIMEWFIEQTPKFHDYNICSGKSIALSQIAQEICKQMGGVGVECLEQGLNSAYVGDNTRLLSEIKGFTPISIEDGIRRQIQWLREEQE